MLRLMLSPRRLLAYLLPAVLVAFAAAPARADLGQARPWIGIEIEQGDRGVRIKAVREKTPAASAGLQAGDQVLTIDGKNVKAPGELIASVQEKGVGTKVALHVLRGTGEVDVQLALAARPDEAQLLRELLVDKPAPTFSLEKVAGPHAAALADLKGQVVIVEFWATWCGPCRQTMPVLSAWQKKYGARGLRVVGISSETRAAIDEFLAARKDKLPYTIARDEGGTISSAYGVPAIPTLVIVDREGKVRFAEVGAGSNLDVAEATFLPLLAPAPAVAPARKGGAARPTAAKSAAAPAHK
jgi:thiol-disulfide isomerase/thioredoxin